MGIVFRLSVTYSVILLFTHVNDLYYLNSTGILSNYARTTRQDNGKKNRLQVSPYNL